MIVNLVLLVMLLFASNIIFVLMELAVRISFALLVINVQVDLVKYLRRFRVLSTMTVFKVLKERYARVSVNH